MSDTGNLAEVLFTEAREDCRRSARWQFISALITGAVFVFVISPYIDSTIALIAAQTLRSDAEDQLNAVSPLVAEASQFNSQTSVAINRVLDAALNRLVDQFDRLNFALDALAAEPDPAGEAGRQAFREGWGRLDAALQTQARMPTQAPIPPPPPTIPAPPAPEPGQLREQIRMAFIGQYSNDLLTLLAPWINEQVIDPTFARLNAGLHQVGATIEEDGRQLHVRFESIVTTHPTLATSTGFVSFREELLPLLQRVQELHIEPPTNDTWWRSEREKAGFLAGARWISEDNWGLAINSFGLSEMERDLQQVYQSVVVETQTLTERIENLATAFEEAQEALAALPFSWGGLIGVRDGTVWLPAIISGVFFVLIVWHARALRQLEFVMLEINRSPTVKSAGDRMIKAHKSLNWPRFVGLLFLLGLVGVIVSRLRDGVELLVAGQIAIGALSLLLVTVWFDSGRQPSYALKENTGGHSPNGTSVP